MNIIDLKEELHLLYEEFVFNRDNVDKDRLIILSKNYIDMLEVLYMKSQGIIQ